MTDDEEIDVEALQQELDQIKDAMGLQERYPGRFQFWLVFGVLVAVASAISQYVVLADLPEYYHAIGWFGTMSVGGIYIWYVGDGYADGSGDAGGKPGVLLAFGSVFAYYVVISASLGPLSGPSELVETAIFHSMIVGLVGVGYLVLGNLLRAYYIRKRDRYALYLGGAWMIAFAAVVPNVEVLYTWSYALYGGLYFVYAVVTYVILRRSGSESDPG